MELTEVIKLAIELVVAVASLWLIPWLRARLNAEQVSDMLRWVEIAVSAAEQLYEATDGEAKKRYVVAFLERHDIKLKHDALDAAIEAAVLRLHKEITA